MGEEGLSSPGFGVGAARVGRAEHEVGVPDHRQIAWRDLEQRGQLGRPLSLHHTAQALEARVGDFSGRVLDLRTGFTFRIADHFDAGLYFNRFDLDLDLEKRSWSGTLDFDYHGPQLTLAARF